MAVASLYQASEDIYNTFDKVTLLYEGRQIFFGTTTAAKVYFTNLEFVCFQRSTTADFLCSLTNSLESIVGKGYEIKVSRSSDEFAQIWNRSVDRDKVKVQIQFYENKFSLDSQDKQDERGLFKLPWQS